MNIAIYRKWFFWFGFVFGRIQIFLNYYDGLLCSERSIRWDLSGFVTQLGDSVFRVQNDDMEEELNNEHAVDNPDEIAASVEMYVFFFHSFFVIITCLILA